MRAHAHTHTHTHKRISPFAFVSHKVGKTRHVITILVSFSLTMLVSEPAPASLWEAIQQQPTQSSKVGWRVLRWSNTA